MPTLASRLRGGLYGLLVGDMVGVPFEFHPPERLPPPEALDTQLPPGFRRSHPDAPLGAWSDDGAQALCLLDSLLAKGSFDARDFADRLVAWATRGYLAVEHEVFDIGFQTQLAITRIQQGVLPLSETGGDGERSNGNGSLMRVLPLALWCTGTDEELVAWAHAQSRLTHAHPRSQVCCAYYCLVARHLLEGTSLAAARTAAGHALHALYRGAHAEEWAALEVDLRERQPQGSGYVVDTLCGALKALEQPDFASVVRYAISLGHDTDTTAAVAGGLAGLIHGWEGLPAHWLAALAGPELVGPLAEKLVQRHMPAEAPAPKRPE